MKFESFEIELVDKAARGTSYLCYPESSTFALMAGNANHCSFVLLAEFHILEGAQLKYQFPQPLGVDERYNYCSSWRWKHLNSCRSQCTCHVYVAGWRRNTVR